MHTENVARWGEHYLSFHGISHINTNVAPCPKCDAMLEQIEGVAEHGSIVKQIRCQSWCCDFSQLEWRDLHGVEHAICLLYDLPPAFLGQYYVVLSALPDLSETDLSL